MFKFHPTQFDPGEHLDNAKDRTREFIDKYIISPKHQAKARLVYDDLKKLASDISPFLGRHFDKIFGFLCIVLAIFSITYFFFWRAPRPFPEHKIVTIERGMSLSQISHKFEDEKVVRSAISLRVMTILLGGEKRVVAGDYYFPSALSVFSVAKMIHGGEFGLIPVKITVLEGMSSFEIAEQLSSKMPYFDKQGFIDEVQNGKYEGYLFPDTYFFMPNTKPGDIVLIMRENFARQVHQYQKDIDKFGKPLEEVVIMASILEGEARGIANQRVVADILWRRIRKDMPLQVDAPFKYFNGKNSYTLTKTDLKDDHDYNTYTNKGLPKTPISNPGLDAIRAAITPTPNQYYYFMSDQRGNMYYAVDFEGHKRNRELYLR
jgi:UPF0755 protein